MFFSYNDSCNKSIKPVPPAAAAAARTKSIIVPERGMFKIIRRLEMEKIRGAEELFVFGLIFAGNRDTNKRGPF